MDRENGRRSDRDVRKKRKRRVRPDEEMELMEHLDELRVRLFRCILGVGIAGIVAWFWLYEPIYNALVSPFNQVLAAKGIKTGLTYTSVSEPFFLKIKVTMLLALALASPVILWEAWGFISPGLHEDERKPFRFVFPLSVLLFAFGAGMAYTTLPTVMQFFLSYMQADAMLLPRAQEYLLFVVKMCGAFGLGFELPVVMMFLGKVGLVTSRDMKRFWRQALVVIMLLAAILTPSSDPLTMMMMAGPMSVLYLASILLVRWVEPKSDVDVEDSGPQAADSEKKPKRGAPPVPVNPDEED